MRWARWSGGVVLVPVLLAGPVAGTASAAAGPAGVAAKSAFLFDLKSGKVRWTRSADTKRPIASITKVMTAWVVIQRGNLDRKITVKQKYIDYAVRHGGSMAYLRAGDKITARQLLYGLLLPSGCDAAYALADVYGAGWKPFVKRMNSTAKRLGMTRTKYANFDGLPWPTATSGYSTARDQTKLVRAAMKNATFRAVVVKSKHTLPAGGGHKAYTWNSTNKLLTSYAGATGVKTGYTNAAGYSLMFAANRKGRTLVGVVLNSSTSNANARFTDAAKVLNWGYR